MSALGRFWAVALGCQQERGPRRNGTEIGVRVLDQSV